MSVFTGSIYSRSLQKETHLTIILPQDSRPHVGINGKLMDGLLPRPYPRTLILLHGATDINDTWVRRTSLERYAELYDMAILMPDGEVSYYADMEFGPAYFTYITDELPKLAEKMFCLDVSPENLYVAGLSMGSMGALKCMLTYPNRYAACGAFSGAGRRRDEDNTLPKNKIGLGAYLQLAAYGDPPEMPEYCDAYWLAEHMRPKEVKKIYMCVGYDDFIYQPVHDFGAYLKTHPMVDLVYEEWEGAHEWGFWDVAIQKFFALYIK